LLSQLLIQSARSVDPIRSAGSAAGGRGRVGRRQEQATSGRQAAQRLPPRWV